jgi:hypothetical protein
MEPKIYNSTPIHLEFEIRMGSVAFVNGQWTYWTRSSPYTPINISFTTLFEHYDESYKRSIQETDWLSN